MREIKFRAWAGKSMVEDYGNTQYVEYYGWDNKYFKVMQYTGLKDNNGKDIYEDDIVVFDAMTIDPQMRLQGVVKFEDGRFFHTATMNNSSVYWNVEVIGNIHENPELL